MGTVRLLLISLVLWVVSVPPTEARACAVQEPTPDVPAASAEVKAQELRSQLTSALPMVGILEVGGRLPESVVRQANAFLLEPSLAVTSAWVLAGGSSLTLRFGKEVRHAKVCGWDWMQDVALLELDSSLPFEHGLPLREGPLLGQEQVAVIGTTALGEPIAKIGALAGAVLLDPLPPVGQMADLADLGLAGSPLLNERGKVIGMLSTRVLESSGLRLVVSGSAIGQVGRIAPIALDPELLKDRPYHGADEEALWLAGERGIEELLSGQPSRAIESLWKAPGEQARLWLGLALTQCHRDVEALEMLESFEDGTPFAGMAHLIRGRAYHNLLQHREETLEFARARAGDPLSAPAVLSLAEAYFHVDRGLDALQLLKGILQERPRNIPALLLKGQILNKRLRLEESRACFETALVEDPDQPQAWCGMGQIHLHQNATDRARQCYERALAADPNCVEAKVGLCQADLDEREWEKGLARMAPLLEAYPRHVKLLTLAAEAHARLHHDEQARDLYEKATFLDPDNAEAYLGLGLTFKELLEYERAIQAFDEVLRVDPKNSAALFSAGTCHLILGNRGDARSRYRLLLLVDPVAADRLFRLIYNK
ncbi:MAG: tetratricopeptide repeat protein [Planctomycetes bacterium]|nr:tetratricopeptide repeat protein [Planctomycetota bacterium]MCB9909112.1 tetratricopeptide repeat protein [Planctomycetota bacterium]MCB9911638.1 tetratricopeptide repeat protein [Planctomycetota bacterium]HPF14721.1 tetratricopeptide repeat protein [Planctomycetota bacterium]